LGAFPKHPGVIPKNRGINFTNIKRETLQEGIKIRKGKDSPVPERPKKGFPNPGA